MALKMRMYMLLTNDKDIQMTDSPLVCFCTEKTEEDVKAVIRENMTPTTEVENPLIFKVHKDLAGEALVGRCCGCMDEVEDLMLSYCAKKWS